MSNLTSYVERLLEQLDEIEEVVEAVVALSGIENVNWPDGFIGFAPNRWTESSPDMVAARMEALAKVEDFEARFRLLFPHPTPEVSSKMKKSFGMLRRWMKRARSDHEIPSNMEAAKLRIKECIDGLRDLTELLPVDPWAIRLVVDTNILCDEPDLTVHEAALGGKYIVHLVPVVFRELDDLKRNGRNPDIRESARRADKRLKGLRDNGDVQKGVRVAGDVFAVFEHREPRSDSLPKWLELAVPDDRFVASALLLQSNHPGSRVVVATGDMNLQNKLSAVGIPFIEL